MTIVAQLLKPRVDWIIWRNFNLKEFLKALNWIFPLLSHCLTREFDSTCLEYFANFTIIWLLKGALDTQAGISALVRSKEVA